MTLQSSRLAAAALILIAGASPVLAADTINLVLKDHRFTPADVTAPAGERFNIMVTNQDDTPAEFESADLRVEKIAAPGVTIKVIAGPLKPGVYKFVDDYHPDTAIGTVTVAAPKS